MRQFLIFFLLLVSLAGYANLPEMPLKLSLVSAQTSYPEGEPMEFNLIITNTHKLNSYPVILPKKNKSSQKLFTIKVYANNGTSSPQVAENFSYSSFNNEETKIVQLAPGQTIRVKMYVNHKLKEYGNDGRYHFLSNFLKHGNYSFRVFYNPYGIAPSGLYNYINSTKDEVQPGKITFWTTGNPSELCYITITAKNKNHLPQLSECAPNCRFCANVEKQKWNKVKRLLNKTTQQLNAYNLKHCYRCNDSSWVFKHKTLEYFYINENVLDILPTSMYGQIGLKSKDSVYYFNMTYQLGKIYKGRSRLRQILHLITRLQFKGIKTSSQYYIKLKHFTPAKQKYKPE